VWTIERYAELSRGAEEAVGAIGIRNVTFVVGDGHGGLAEAAPFDAINVAAATRDAVPPALIAQLAPGGRLVAPVGESDQHLMLIRRRGDELVRTTLEAVRFVPLLRGTR
jgi:protein-L-isoaspartate(D-aspartate) O-methyltransferase